MQDCKLSKKFAIFAIFVNYLFAVAGKILVTFAKFFITKLTKKTQE